MLAPARTPPRLSTLILLTSVATLSLNMYLPSLISISDDLDTSYSAVSFSIAGYLAVTAVLQLVLGPLSDRYGRRPVILAAFAIFIVASIGCFLARDIVTFLIFRMLQSAVVAGSTLSRAIVRDRLPADQAAGVLGTIGMIMAVAPMLGPVLGGALEAGFGWRASFAAYSAMGLGLLVLAWADLGETNDTPSPTFRAQFRAYPALITSQRFWSYAICMTFAVGAFFIFLAGAPLVATHLFDATPELLGIYLGSITGGFVFGNFLSSRLSAGRAPTTMMSTGCFVASAGLAVGLLLLSAGVVHEVTLFGATIFVGLGNGLTMPNATAGVMSVRPGLLGSAAGLSGAMIMAGGAVLTQTAGLVVTETTAGFGLLGLMLTATLISLAAALRTAQLERRAAAPA